MNAEIGAKVTPKQLEVLKLIEGDPKIGHRQAAKLLVMAPSTLQSYIQQH